MFPKNRKFMKYLKKSDLNLVNPKFRKIVQDAWDNGEKVPYGVIYLSSKEPTKEDIEYAKKLIKENKNLLQSIYESETGQVTDMFDKNGELK